MSRGDLRNVQGGLRWFAMETDRSADRILLHLKTKGPQPAALIARRLGVTAMAVRQHLYALRDSGLVTYEDERRKVGRPARIWRITANAQSRFPDSHAELTVDMLAIIRATFGEKGIDRLMSERTRIQTKAYGERMRSAGKSLEARVNALAKLRAEQGYMAESARQRDGSFLLIENHCPICAAATSCQGLCREELMLFARVLGDDVNVERTDHILAGARRCAYRIKPNTGH
jgi:predicted ArsR family transcriptional regulator